MFNTFNVLKPIGMCIIGVCWLGSKNIKALLNYLTFIYGQSVARFG